MLDQSQWTRKYRTEIFEIPLLPNMRVIEIKGNKIKKFKIKYVDNQNSYVFDLELIRKEGNISAEELVKTKFALHNHSAFSHENLSPYKYDKQNSRLNAWGCRFRFVDGGVIAGKMQIIFMELDHYILMFSFLASPEVFDFGYLILQKIVLNVNSV